jgi:hypothetical protein
MPKITKCPNDKNVKNVKNAKNAKNAKKRPKCRECNGQQVLFSTHNLLQQFENLFGFSEDQLIKKYYFSTRNNLAYPTFDL